MVEKLSRRATVRLPGFLLTEEVGLGDVVKRVTYKAGVKACPGCQRRATKLNGWLSFAPRSRPRHQGR
jgi:hypothetical protein